MSSKSAQPVQRAYRHLDHIALQRQVDDVRRLAEEVRRAEASMSAAPINPTGMNDPGRAYMVSQQAQAIAERREAVKAAEALDGDARVLRYCGVILAESAAPLSGQVTINLDVSRS